MFLVKNNSEQQKALGQMVIQIPAIQVKQVRSMNTFKSSITNKVFTIYNKLNCKSKYLSWNICYVTSNTQANQKCNLV